MFVHDPLLEPVFVAGDHNSAFSVARRRLFRAVTIVGNDGDGGPLVDQFNYGTFRHALILRTGRLGRTNDPSIPPGDVPAVAFAVPAMAQGQFGAVGIAPMLAAGKDRGSQLNPADSQPPFRLVYDYGCPDGTQEVLPGDEGILLPGLNANKQSNVFVNTRARLLAHHQDNNFPELSTRVYDIDGDVRGMWAGLQRMARVVALTEEAWRTASFYGVRAGAGASP